jgi:hypothetical protein
VVGQLERALWLFLTVMAIVTAIKLLEGAFIASDRVWPVPVSVIHGNPCANDPVWNYPGHVRSVAQVNNDTGYAMFRVTCGDGVMIDVGQ